jgi:hypothetical protein
MDSLRCGPRRRSRSPLLATGLLARRRRARRPARMALPRPRLRSQHAMAFDSQRQRTVLFGGWPAPAIPTSSPRPGNGTVCAGPSASPRFAPPARFACGLAYDSARGVTVLFGGRDPPETCSADTWEWNGSTWTQRTRRSRRRHGTTSRWAYDASRRRVVLFGGKGGTGQPSGNARRTRGEWDGTLWRQIPTTASPAPQAARLAYDSARQHPASWSGPPRPGNTPPASGRTRTMPSQPPSSVGGCVAYDAASGDDAALRRDATLTILQSSDLWGWDGASWQFLNQGPTATLPGPRPVRRAGHTTPRVGGPCSWAARLTSA